METLDSAKELQENASAIVADPSKAEIEAFLDDPKNKENALALAIQIQNVVGKNWFTFQQFINKTKDDQNEAWRKLHLLRAFSYISQRIGDFKDGRKNLRQPLYKVDISKEDRLLTIDRVIEYYKAQIEQLELERKNYL